MTVVIRISPDYKSDIEKCAMDLKMDFQKSSYKNNMESGNTIYLPLILADVLITKEGIWIINQKSHWKAWIS